MFDVDLIFYKERGRRGGGSIYSHISIDYISSSSSHYIFPQQQLVGCHVGKFTFQCSQSLQRNQHHHPQ